MRGIPHHWGSTAAERTAKRDCDALVPEGVVLTRAVAVAAPAHVVFRWLCQLRAAPYSYDRLDNLGRRSPQELTPGLEHLEPGQTFMRIFTLASLEAGREITLRLRRARRIFGDVAVTYAALPDAAGEPTRVLMRLAWRPPGPALLRAPVAATLAAGDLVMARRQLLNLKGLAERDAARSGNGRPRQDATPRRGAPPRGDGGAARPAR